MLLRKIKMKLIVDLYFHVLNNLKELCIHAFITVDFDQKMDPTYPLLKSVRGTFLPIPYGTFVSPNTQSYESSRFKFNGTLCERRD